MRALQQGKNRALYRMLPSAAAYVSYENNSAGSISIPDVLILSPAKKHTQSYKYEGRRGRTLSGCASDIRQRSSGGARDYVTPQ